MLRPAAAATDLDDFTPRITLARTDAPCEPIHWALGMTRLGPLAMATTPRGVCFAEFGEDPAALEATLVREFSTTTLTRSEHDTSLNDWIAAFEAYLNAAAPPPSLPLDLRGTAFQLRVWRFLLEIPPGLTRSYAEVASGIGAPAATRAVGSACGANPVAVLVPCHRVLCSDGRLGGYRGGLERKRALLAAEAVVPRR